MKIGMLVSAYPPLPSGVTDGIADYTQQLVRELKDHTEIRVYSGSPGRNQAFDHSVRRSLWGLRARILEDRPDWVVIQYNPFSFGRGGLNPFLPSLAWGLRKHGVGVALMIHEPFVPIWGQFKGPKVVAMSLLQQAQLLALGQASQVIFCSIEAWSKKFGRWFPTQRPETLAVGSNIPKVEMSRSESRSQLGLSDGEFALGTFGSLHPGKQVSWVEDVKRAIESEGGRVRVLSIGAGGSLGILSPEAVSRTFSAMDLSLCPFLDGVSCRRTSFMTGLQHGVASVATQGELTDSVLVREQDRSLMLSPVSQPEDFVRRCRDLYRDPILRSRIAAAGQELYRKEFDWPVSAHKLLVRLGATQ